MSRYPEMYSNRGPFADLKIKLLNLNTVHKPIPGFMDETPRAWCSKCKNWLDLGYDMRSDDTLCLIAQTHMELCEGDAAVTLMKIEQLYKELTREDKHDDVSIRECEGRLSHDLQSSND